MVMDGGGNGPMVSDCGPIGMGRGSNGPTVVVVFSAGHGLQIYWSGSSPIY